MSLTLDIRYGVADDWTSVCFEDHIFLKPPETSGETIPAIAPLVAMTVSNFTTLTVLRIMHRRVQTYVLLFYAPTCFCLLFHGWWCMYHNIIDIGHDIRCD